MPAPRRALIAVTVLALSAVSAAAAPAATPTTTPPIPELIPKDAAAARQLARQRVAGSMLNAAARHVQGVKPSCRLAPPRAGTEIQGTPSAEVLAAVAAFRRPPGAADAAPAGSRQLGPLGGDRYTDYRRVVTAADGQKLALGIVRTTLAFEPPSAACLDAQHAELARQARAVSPQIRATALRLFEEMRAQYAKFPAPEGPHDGFSLATLDADGRAGGGTSGSSVEDLLAHGMFMSMGGGPSSGRSSRLVGLVPDGVAAIRLEYPKVVTRGPLYKPTVYPEADTRTVRVQENVVSLRVARAAIDAFPPKMVWLDAAGATIREVAQP